MCGTFPNNSIENVLMLFICFFETSSLLLSRAGTVQTVALPNGPIDLPVTQNQVPPRVVELRDVMWVDRHSVFNTLKLITLLD